MDEMINNVKSIGSTLTGIIAGIAGIAKTLGYELDPTFLQKISVDGLAFVAVGVYLIFGIGKKTAEK